MRADPRLRCVAVPVADGGEGTLDVFFARGWRRVERTVRGPLGEPVRAAFAIRGTRAVVESAQASGLAPAGEPRDVLRASTYGTGELVRAALDAGAREIVVAIGGTATNDGGAGMLEALGLRLTREDGAALEPGGGALARLARVSRDGLDPRLAESTFVVANDVASPLVGPHGASAVYGPQKGASPADVRVLDAALARFADASAVALGSDVRDEPGTGAGGGLAYGLRAYLGARFRAGFEIVAEVVGLADHLAGARYCFSGEGSIDAQTLAGKTADGVTRFAREAGVPTVVFGGRVDPFAERAFAERGALVVPIADGPLDLAECCARAGELLERAAFRTTRLLGVR